MESYLSDKAMPGNIMMPYILEVDTTGGLYIIETFYIMSLIITSQKTANLELYTPKF